GLNVSSQLSAIFITIVSALIFGFVSGKIISIFGRRQEAYVDAEEFEDAED
ncbi:MAG: ammonium transporter, partial [Marinilabiliales bacterium]